MVSRKELKNKYKDEKVLVVPFERVKFIEDGFTEIKHDPKIWSMFDNGTLVYRYETEGISDFQQIIPYILIFNNEKTKLFTTKRIAGDNRLINKLSIACGGHISQDDFGKELLFKAAVRELFEEVDVNPIAPFEIIGYVRDMTSSTNDHTGVVIALKVKDKVTINENDNLIGEWMGLDELTNNYNRLEGWSKHIVDYFVDKGKFI